MRSLRKDVEASAWESESRAGASGLAQSVSVVEEWCLPRGRRIELSLRRSSFGRWEKTGHGCSNLVSPREDFPLRSREAFSTGRVKGKIEVIFFRVVSDFPTTSAVCLMGTEPNQSLQPTGASARG